MRVLINAVSARMGGAATYLEGLVRECAKFPEHEFIWYISPNSKATFEDAPGNFRVVTTCAGSLPSFRRFYWDQVTFRKVIKRVAPDLVFSTGNFGVLFCPVEQVLLVTQSIPFSSIWLREVFPRKPILSRLEIRLRRWLICLSARRAGVVMTPTQAMSDDLQRFTNVDSRKILVNPFGVDSLGDIWGLPGEQRSSMGFRNPETVRLCYISLYAEHKNLGTLLRAMSLVNHSSSQRFLLKTTVNPGWEDARRACTQKDDIELSKLPEVRACVEFVGPLAAKETRILYCESDIFVFPSIAESFGYPMTEAMSLGLPIVAADTPVNREMCGDAAIYFSPLEPAYLAQAIHGVATDPPLRRRLGLEGQRRVRNRFRWDTHVRRILEIARAEQREVLPGSSQNSLAERGEECLLPRTVNKPL